MKRPAAFTCLLALVVFGSARSTAQQSKPIPVGVKVESEGGGEGQGMWTQAANDLTPKETKALEALVTAQIRNQPDIKLVPLDYPDDYVGVVVVAAKLTNGNAGSWYVASSVVNVATKKGTDEFLTHDVIAAGDLPSLARSIGYQFASARFRATLGLWK